MPSQRLGRSDGRAEGVVRGAESQNGQTKVDRDPRTYWPFQSRLKISPTTSAAIHEVSTRISSTGRHPASARCFRLVFMPSAAMATTRQTRDSQPSPCCNGAASAPAELTATSAMKSHRNQGTSGCLVGRVDGAARPVRVPA